MHVLERLLQSVPHVAPLRVPVLNEKRHDVGVSEQKTYPGTVPN
jgi:hypothetical protein